MKFRLQRFFLIIIYSFVIFIFLNMGGERNINTVSKIQAEDDSRAGGLQDIGALTGSGQRVLKALNYRLPQDSEWNRDVKLARLNATDTSLYIVTASWGPENFLYRYNSTSGEFVDYIYNLPVDNYRTWAIAIGDVDGDDKLDLFLATKGQNQLYRNKGLASYEDKTVNLPVYLDDSRDARFGDVDADSDLDIVIANWDNQNRLYLNNGSGTFSDASIQLPQGNKKSRAVVLVDIDSDNDLDIFFANEGQDSLYLNNGSGNFSDVTTNNLPQVVDNSYDAEAADIDNDSDLDLVITNWPSPDESTHWPYQRSWPNQDRLIKLYLNDGTGDFNDATSTNLPTIAENKDGYMPDARGVALGDVDNDSDIDIFIANQGQDYLYLNNGSGMFANVTNTNLPIYEESSEEESWDAEFFDVDSDGDLDLVIAHDGQDRFYRNNGSGIFEDYTIESTPSDVDSSKCVTSGDIDNDSDLDLFIGNFYQQNRLYRNQGNGNYEDITYLLPPDNDPTTSAEFSDIDGDSDLDLIIGNWGAANKIYENKMTEGFINVSDTHFPDADEIAFTHDIAVGDFNHDNQMDILDTGHRESRFYINVGGGVYEKVPLLYVAVLKDKNKEGVVETEEVILKGVDTELVDVNGDSYLDIVVAKWGSPDELYLYDTEEEKFFELTDALPEVKDKTTKITAGDIDGDGDQDLVLANWNGQDRFYLNNGQGYFEDVTEQRLPFYIGQSVDVDLSDFEKDGDLDIFITSADGWSRLYLNNGQGYFADATDEFLFDPIDQFATDAIWQDLTKDDYPDLFVTVDKGQNRLLENKRTNIVIPLDMEILSPYIKKNIENKIPLKKKIK